MLLQESDNIKIASYYTKRSDTEFLGFLPALDPDEHSYYTVSNEHPHRDYDRVSPIFGVLNLNIRTELEHWYIQPELPKGSRLKLVLNHELYRDEVIERIERCPYCVWFVGCDDGDKFMRFENKEAALEFFKYIDFFEEIVSHPLCQPW